MKLSKIEPKIKIWKTLPIAILCLSSLQAQAGFFDSLFGTTPSNQGGNQNSNSGANPAGTSQAGVGQPQSQAQESTAAEETQSLTPLELLCSGFAKTDVMVDGVKTQRYVISKSEFLKCLPPEQPAPWKVLKEKWTDQDENSFKNFVYSIGKAVEAGRCDTIDTCLASSANPYRDQMDIDGTHFADCADMPIYLRSYFAYKNQLPMSFGVGLTGNPATPEQIAEAELKVSKNTDRVNNAINQGLPMEEVQKRQDELLKVQHQLEDVLNVRDTRYTRNGNYFSSRINVPHSRGAARDFWTVASQIHDGISSGSYRMLMTAPGQTPADFYAPAINKNSITIGTVTYKPTGHVAMVYDISKNGDVYLIDSHPDNSLTRVSYSSEFMRSLPTHGAGFKNWRPFQLANVTRDKQGYIATGKFQFAKDQEIPNFSLEQYFGNLDANNVDSKSAKFVIGGRSLDWYDYVKVRLATGVYKLNPIFQFQTEMNNLCVDLQGRANSVNTAIQAKVHTLEHPAQLPQNIYGSDGDWEAYSTPGRDLRIRKRAKDMVELAKSYLSKYQSRDPYFEYYGTNLKRDLLKVYNQVNSTCMISYQNSQGQEVKMGLSTALKRVTSMSFDPYFCVERRWGATSRAEVATCADDTEKAEWYQFQQFLRNATERDPTEVMGWSLPQLKELNRRGAVDSSDHSNEYNILKKLNEL